MNVDLLLFPGVKNLSEGESVKQCLSMDRYRRHSRAVVHAHRDRLYKVHNTEIARNRCKKTSQVEDSFEDITLTPEQKRNLKVIPGKNVLKPSRSKMPTVAGDVWQHVPSGKRFVAESVLSGKYLYSPMLKDVLGKNYVHPDTCRCIIQNEGIVIK